MGDCSRSAEDSILNAAATGPQPIRGNSQLARTDAVRGFSWGFVSQGLSSCTNLALSLMAGRVLGPGGLGVISVSFLTYLTLLGFQRALITDPLVAFSAPLPLDERRAFANRALTLVLVGALVATGLALGVSFPASGAIARGILLSTPWILPALLQDFWRVRLFRDDRARSAALNDLVWLATMAAAIPGAWAIGSDWAITGCWGLGGLAGAAFGFAQTRSVPSVRGSFSWWLADLSPLGRWLGANSLTFAVLSYGTAIVIVELVGAASYGGLRAVTVVFAPLSFVGAALALPGLPALTRAWHRSEHAAASLAVKVGAASGGVTVLYLGLLALGGGAVISRVFGHAFGQYGDLVWPVGLGQIISAVTVGFGLLLTAQRRGSAILFCTLVGSGTSLLLAFSLGDAYGLRGVAWGMALAALLGTVCVTLVALRPRTLPERIGGAFRGTCSPDHAPHRARVTSPHGRGAPPADPVRPPIGRSRQER